MFVQEGDTFIRVSCEYLELFLRFANSRYCYSKGEFSAAQIVVAYSFLGTCPGRRLFALQKSTFWANACSLWCEDVSYSYPSPSNKMVLSGFSIERLIFHPCLFILSSLWRWNINAVKGSSELCCPQGNWSQWRHISFPVIRLWAYLPQS